MSDRKLIREIKQLSPKAEITPEEDEALLYVRSLLAGGVIKHCLLSDISLLVGQGFNMSAWFSRERCGTIGCISGYMCNYLGVSEVEYLGVDEDEVELPPRKPRQIDLLFYPPGVRHWNLITTQQAVKAIDNFRETGNPQWVKVCRELV